MTGGRKLLVFGRSGQLARALAELSLPPGIEVEFAGRDRFDLATRDPGELIRGIGPAVVINASGYTAVDGAEREVALAERLNRDAPAEMARACADLGAPLVHVSTDYVFDGEKGAPYTEADPPRPLNNYGRTKLAGENAVLDSGAEVAVVRTSWVFGASAQNFLGLLLRQLDGPDEARMVSDKHARPTFAPDLAAGVLQLALGLADHDSAARGMFHLAGADDATRVEMAEVVFDWARARGRRTPRIVPVPTSAFPAPAVRPLDTRLACERITALGILPLPWRERLAHCLQSLEP